MKTQTSNRILLIGGNGFIGSHLVDSFLLKKWNVRVLDKFPERFRQPNPNVEYLIADFSDTAVLREALNEIDTVVHLVSTTVPGTSNDNCIYDIESNLIPTVKLLDAMRTKKCLKIVYLSSGGTVYGNPEIVPTPENSILQPISSYGVVKSAIENYISMYSKLYGINSLIIRPSNLYGNRQGQTGVQGLIHTLFQKITSHQVLEVWGNGQNVRDYIFIDDLVELLSLAIEKSATGIYNAGSGLGYSVNEIIKMISEITVEEPKIKYSEARSFDVEKIILDSRKAKIDLNWQANTSIENGIKKMWNNRITVAH